MGVWIETMDAMAELINKDVTPYVGVWIETYYAEYNLDHKKSLLMWECGLKHHGC